MRGLLFEAEARKLENCSSKEALHLKGAAWSTQASCTAKWLPREIKAPNEKSDVCHFKLHLILLISRSYQQLKGLHVICSLFIKWDRRELRGALGVGGACAAATAGRSWIFFLFFLIANWSNTVLKVRLSVDAMRFPISRFR